MLNCLSLRRLFAAALVVPFLQGAPTEARVVVPGGDQAGLGQPRDAEAAQRLRDRSRALDIYGRAARAVTKRRPACRPSTPRVDNALTTDAPRPATLELVAALRRPAVAEDALAVPGPGFLTFGQVYSAYTRAALLPDGTRVTIVPARLTALPTVPSSSCRDAQAAAARRLAERAGRGVRRELEEVLREVRADDADALRPTQPPADGIFLAVPFAGRTMVLSGGDAADFAKRGVVGFAGDPAHPVGVGLVPDGVATVDVAYPRVVDLGALYKPLVYPKSLRATVPVRDNLFMFEVPDEALRRFSVRFTWRSASGDVVQRVGPRRRSGR